MYTVYCHADDRIDVHIGHDSGVACIQEIIHCLVFATTRKEMALQSVLYNPVRKTKC